MSMTMFGFFLLWTVLVLIIGVLLSRRIITTATDLYSDLVREARRAQQSEAGARYELQALKEKGAALEQKIEKDVKAIVPMFLMGFFGFGDILNSAIAQHPYLAMAAISLILFAVFNAVVQALEKPTATSGGLYRFTYRFLHFLSFNFQYALKSKFPQYVPDAKQPEESQ